MSKTGLIVVDPGHFHAALAQKEMYPNVAETVRVYAPVGLDLVDYLTRIARFNTRGEAPTSTSRWLRLAVTRATQYSPTLHGVQTGFDPVVPGDTCFVPAAHAPWGTHCPAFVVDE